MVEHTKVADIYTVHELAVCSSAVDMRLYIALELNCAAFPGRLDDDCRCVVPQTPKAGLGCGCWTETLLAVIDLTSAGLTGGRDMPAGTGLFRAAFKQILHLQSSGIRVKSVLDLKLTQAAQAGASQPSQTMRRLL